MVVVIIILRKGRLSGKRLWDSHGTIDPVLSSVLPLTPTRLFFPSYMVI